MSDWIAVAKREIGRITSRKSLLFLVVAWPVLYGILLGGVYSEKVVTRMPIAVVDLDQTSLSRTLVRYLNASRSFQVEERLSSVEEIEDRITRESIVAGVYIPRGLQREIKRGGAETVTAYVSGVNLLMANIALSELKTILGTVSAGVKIKYLRKTGNSSEKAMTLQSPIQVDLLRLHNPGFNYQNYLAPGLWATAIQQILLLLGALLLGREIELGTFRDAWSTSGRRLPALLGGKIIPYFVVSVLLLELYFRVFYPLFSVDTHGSTTVMVLYSCVFVFSCLGMGSLISVAAGSSVNAMKGVLLVAAPAFLISGYMWPLFMMPWPVKFISYCIPLTTYLKGFRKVYQEGVGLLDVGPEMLILVLIGVCSLLVAGVLLKRKIRKGATG